MSLNIRWRYVAIGITLAAIFAIALRTKVVLPEPEKLVARAIWSEEHNRLLIHFITNPKDKGVWKYSTECIHVGKNNRIRREWLALDRFVAGSYERGFIGIRESEDNRLEFLTGSGLMHIFSTKVSAVGEIEPKPEYAMACGNEAGDTAVILSCLYSDRGAHEGAVKLWRKATSPNPSEGKTFKEFCSVKTFNAHRLLTKTLKDVVLLYTREYAPEMYEVTDKGLEKIIPRLGQFAPAVDRSADCWSIAGDVSPDRKFASIAGIYRDTYDPTLYFRVHIWNVGSGQIVHSFEHAVPQEDNRDQHEVDICFSDNRTIAIGGQGKVRQIKINVDKQGDVECDMQPAEWRFPTGNCYLCRPLSADHCLVVYQKLNSDQLHVEVINREQDR
jgi:hypothetical protein